MGLCVTKPTSKQPKTLIRLIKVESESTIPKPPTLIDLQTKILQLWLKLEKHLNKLYPCQRTHQLLQHQQQINLLLSRQQRAIPMSEANMNSILEYMEKIALIIEELIREELLIEESSTKFQNFNIQILELSMDYANLKNYSLADKTQLSSFI